jgi:low affinity Fe/Cu permease
LPAATRAKTDERTGFALNFRDRRVALACREGLKMNCDHNGCQDPLTLNERFRKFAMCVARFAGSPVAFMISFLIIVVWAIVGPIFHFSDSWQLVINTSTTIVTFLMVFLIQNMQNRDAKAIHLKLDELIRAVKGARNNLVSLENLSEEELELLERQFKRIADKQRHHRQNTPAESP